LGSGGKVNQYAGKPSYSVKSPRETILEATEKNRIQISTEFFNRIFRCKSLKLNDLTEKTGKQHFRPLGK